MKKMKCTTTKQEFENKFKSTINFADLLDKNEKKNEGTTVSGLLQSTTQSVLAPKPIMNSGLEEKLSSLEKNIEHKVDRVESLLQSVIISQQNFQFNLNDKVSTHQSESTQKMLPMPNKQNKSLIFSALLVTTAIIVSSLISYHSSNNKEISLEKIQIKELKIDTPKSIKYVATKFVNMRERPSSRAKKLLIISPNSIIELLESKQGWHRISYIDHLKGLTLTGWIYGENMKLLK